MNAGSNAVYTLTVTLVAVLDTLPTNATFVSSGTGRGTPSAGVATCTAASLANGATANFTIAVFAPFLTGTMPNTASVSA